MKIDPSNKEVFDKIFAHNFWGGDDSRSGPGSDFSQTEALRKTLPGFFLKHKIKSMLDIPCGDFYWMKEIKGSLSGIIDRYIGGDIVSKIVDDNRMKFGDPKFNFEVLDITVSKLPLMDLILCRDCLVHLSYNQIYDALKSIKSSNSKYLLTTSFTDQKRVNKNVATGSWRPLNFQKFPFYFSAPLDVINECCTENNGIYQDKSLLLWEVKKLNLTFFYSFLMFQRIKNRIKRK